MRKILLCVLFAVAGISLASGQGAFIPPQTAFKVVNGFTSPIASATITVCGPNASGIPCSPALTNTIFKDAALTVPLSNPFPSDFLGNYQFAAAAGTYTVTVSALGFVGQSYQVTLLSGGGGIGTITGVTTGSSSGLSGGGLTGTLNLGLLQSCAAGQILQWTGSVWACSTSVSLTNGLAFPSTSPPGMPAFTNFCPTGMNATGTFQRADTSYASFVGVDETTTPGGLGAGTPSDCFRHYFNDTSLPIFMKNALVSIYHTWGNGNTTSTAADDRAFAFRIEPLASISGNQSNSRIQGIYGEVGIKGSPTGFGSGPDQGQDGARIVIDDTHNSTLTTISKAVTGSFGQNATTALYGGCSVCAIGVQGQISVSAAANNNGAIFASFESVTSNGGGATNTTVVDYDAPYSNSGNFSSQFGMWVRGAYRTSDWAFLNDTVAPAYLGSQGIFAGAISSTGGSVPVFASFTGLSALTTGQIAAQSFATVGNAGAPGSTTYTYALCSKDGNGGAVCGATRSTTTGNATLNGSNFNNATYTGSAGVSSFDIYRTVGGVTGKLANVPVGSNSSGTGWTNTCVLNRGASTLCTFNDQGATGDGTTPPTTTLNSTGGLNIAGPGVFSSFGPTLNNWSFICATCTFTTTQQAADYAEWFNAPAPNTNQGLRTQVIYSPPENILVNPFPPNFAPEWRLVPGSVHSTLCDTTHIYCILSAVPIILGAQSTVSGLGPVGSGADMSGGSLIMNDPMNFPGPAGIPTLGTITCSGTGGAGGTFHVAVQFVVNLQTHAGSTPFPGPGAYVTQDVTCGGVTSVLNIPAPTGGLSGSLAKTDYRIGIASALNGNYIVQQPGVATTCGAPGTVDSNNDCKVSGGASTVLMSAIQTLSSSFPMESEEKTGNSVDLSNPLIVMGTPGVSVSFAAQLRDAAYGCQPTGHGVNNPNVLIWDFNVQEHGGSNNGETTIYGDCGGYTGISGAFIYSDTQTPNSTWSQVQMSGGPTSGAVPFYGFICDGRGNSGGTSGCFREIHNVTCALRAGGTASTCFVEQGFRARVGHDHVHMEMSSGNDNFFATDGARGVFNAIEGSQQSGSGNLIHLSSTAGAFSGKGLCPQGSGNSTTTRCSPTNIAVQDDGDTVSGLQPLLGYQADWTSSASASVFGPTTFSSTVKMPTNIQVGTDSGAVNAYVVNNLSPQMTSLANGNQLCFVPLNSNTNGAPTLNVNSLGVTTIVKQNGALATINDMVTTKLACFLYDAANTKWVLTNPASATGTGTGVLATSPTFVTKITTPAITLANVLTSATAPTISSGFGTSPSIVNNNGTATFTINVGTGGTATSGVIGLPAATNGWRVTCDDLTTQSASVFITKQTASSTTTATVTQFNTSGVATAWAASDILTCDAWAR
jgi:hypothetical protein